MQVDDVKLYYMQLSDAVGCVMVGVNNNEIRVIKVRVTGKREGK